jgi:riboflavin biosynthesis pyrimidine reductase
MNTGELEARMHSLYGDVDWTRARGLLHVMAVAGQKDAVLAIGPTSPASATDRFVLGLARARAELILTTGAILRSEPRLQHRYAEDEETNESFAQWRRSVLGLESPPVLLVFSGSGDFSADHPALRGARAGIVWTSKVGRARLGPSAGRLSVEVGIAEGAEAANLAEPVGALLCAARARFEAETVLIEAGPTLSEAFYRLPSTATRSPRVDELLLSRFEGEVASEAIGPSFAGREEIPKLFPEAPTSVRVEEPGGIWRFERYRNSTGE